MDVTTTAIDVERPAPRPNLPNPKPIETAPFKWEVLTPERLPKEERWVRYSITVQDYETLARNMAEILRWVREAEWRLRYYQGELDELEYKGSDEDVPARTEEPQ